MLRQKLNTFILLLFFCVFSSQAETLNKFKETLASYQGKVIYVDFWASWCSPCRKSFPWLNTMQQQYADKGFIVLSINLDAKYSQAQSFLAETPANFPIIYDPKGKIAKALKVQGMPSSLLYNRKGELIARHVGFNEKKQLKYTKEIRHLF